MSKEAVMSQITFEYLEGLETAVGTTAEELSAQIRLIAALKMFELGKLSSGKAAQLAGMSRVAFLEQCGRYHVSVLNYGPEEMETELRADLEAVRDPGQALDAQARELHRSASRWASRPSIAIKAAERSREAIASSSSATRVSRE